MRVGRTLQALKEIGVNASLFDQWSTNLRDYNLLHTFKLHYASYDLVRIAHLCGLANVISTILPFDHKVRLTRPLSWFWRRNIGIQLSSSMLFKQAVIADALIATSQLEAEKLCRAYGLKRKGLIYIIPNGADAKIFGYADPYIFKSAYGLKDYAICVGRIEPNKNQIRLIRAMKGIALNLVIIGRPCIGHETYAKACYEEGRGKTLFIDQLPYNSIMLASAYAGARVFVLPSIAEVAPLSAIEAAMTGVPLVVTRNSLACREYFGNNVFYIDPMSIDNIRMKIRLAIDHNVDQSFTNHVISTHSWKAVAKELKKAYCLVLGETSRNGNTMFK